MYRSFVKVALTPKFTDEAPDAALPLAKIEKAANENGAFRIWFRTPPEYGEANKAVLAILGKLLGMSFRR